MVSLRKIYRPGERYIRDFYKSIAAEQTFTVTNLAGGSQRSKVLYCRPLVPFLFPLTFTGHLISAELKTDTSLLYSDVWTGFWTTARNVGDEVAGLLTALADYVGGTYARGTTSTYTVDSTVYVPYYQGANVTVGAIPYFYIWLMARNVSGVAKSGTVYAKNIRAWSTIGVVKG